MLRANDTSERVHVIAYMIDPIAKAYETRLILSISSKSKCNDQLQAAQIAEISHLTEIRELETGKGANQIQTLQRPGDTRWSSHFRSICSLMRFILIPDMNGVYKDIIRSRHKKDNVTVEHHYRFDVFIAAIDSQLQELNSRFNESVTELLRLSVALDPKRDLRETGKSEIYLLVDRLVRLILTLPVSTTTTERAFSAMKIVKTGLRSTMDDEFLKSCLLLNIERRLLLLFPRIR
ncbi:hypothetical protein OSB04_018934 [Centaurea solstitialis]|uniref:HAT C-terminal dimerisation domain-containing protein n=1 Tax=Centaurea solstitialis TaxID=347529 RepID=A0AA38T2Q2_9ASTR|nr:hypothetical protein OSB04_018934 [Centaurea solstitialis]